MPADKEAKPRYNLHRQSDAYVMLRDGDHPMCSICVKKTRGLLDAQEILLAMNSHKHLLAACERHKDLYINSYGNTYWTANYSDMDAAIAKAKPEQESAK